MPCRRSRVQGGEINESESKDKDKDKDKEKGSFPSIPDSLEPCACLHRSACDTADHSDQRTLHPNNSNTHGWIDQANTDQLATGVCNACIVEQVVCASS